MKSGKGLYTLLALAGSLPFVIAATLLYFRVIHLDGIGNVIEALISYALMIAAFMAGIHWAQYLRDGDNISVNLFISSNIMVVILWLLYLLTPSYIVLTALVVDFSILLILDFMICKARVITITYTLVRVLVTSIVILSLIYVLMYMTQHNRGF